MTEPAHRPSAPDPTFYPEEEQVGESRLHAEISELLVQLVRRWLAARGERACVGGDQFIYWVQYAPTRTVAPDVYVLPDVDLSTLVRTWRVWETGIVPSFVAEVVGRDVRKDYEIAPARYDELGVKELVVYDPGSSRSDERVRFQVWRRRRGKLVLVERTDADRIRSAVLRCHVREIGRGDHRRLRLATGIRGDALVPTGEEAERAAREAAEHEREVARAAREAAEHEREVARAAREAAEQAHDAERAAREAAELARDIERAAREAAERELARLKARHRPTKRR